MWKLSYITSSAEATQVSKVNDLYPFPTCNLFLIIQLLNTAIFVFNFDSFISINKSAWNNQIHINLKILA